MNLTPLFVQKRIANRPLLKKILSNAGWLTFEKLFRMGLALVTSILLARHLGPADFGILNYAISLSAFFGTFIYFGLSGLVIRDTVSCLHEKDVLLGTTFALKMTASVFCIVAMLLIAEFSSEGAKEFWVLIIVGSALLFKPFKTIDLWFHSQTNSKYCVYANMFSSFLISLITIALVLIGTDLIYFAATYAMEFSISALLLIFFYYKNGQNLLLWRWSFKKANELVVQSWILILSSFFSMIYLKIDQVMLRWMVGPSEVGIYSVAVNLSEVWYFLPNAIAISVFPTLIEQKRKNIELYEKKLQKTFDALFLIAAAIAFAVTLLSRPAVMLLYGPEYAKAANILMIHVWAGIFIFMRALFSRIIIIENLFLFSLLTNFAGAVVNIILNFLFIETYKGYGAALSTVVSYCFASYISLFISHRTRPYASMMSRSFQSPFRLFGLFEKGVPNV